MTTLGTRIQAYKSQNICHVQLEAYKSTTMMIIKIENRKLKIINECALGLGLC